MDEFGSYELPPTSYLTRKEACQKMGCQHQLKRNGADKKTTTFSLINKAPTEAPSHKEEIM